MNYQENPSLDEPGFRESQGALFLAWRGVGVACEKCSGSGVVSYGSTSTWRGGVGGSAISNDVCDVCWGSGDKNRQGVNLKLVQSKLESYQALEQSYEDLRRSTGEEIEMWKAREGEAWDVAIGYRQIAKDSLSVVKLSEQFIGKYAIHLKGQALVVDFREITQLVDSIMKREDVKQLNKESPGGE